MQLYSLIDYQSDILLISLKSPSAPIFAAFRLIISACMIRLGERVERKRRKYLRTRYQNNDRNHTKRSLLTYTPTAKIEWRAEMQAR